MFVSNNTQVVAALQMGRSRNKTTMGWLRLIFWESVRGNFNEMSVYINIKDNTICDSLSVSKNVARIWGAVTACQLYCYNLFDC